MTEMMTRDEVLVELDARQSGDHYYQLVVHLGSRTLALLDQNIEFSRAVVVPSDKGRDAIEHPEFYLSGGDVIYGVGKEEFINE